eukprot:1155816-Pelagomonas_calceolata.AAC.1
MQGPLLEKAREYASGSPRLEQLISNHGDRFSPHKFVSICQQVSPVSRAYKSSHWPNLPPVINNFCLPFVTTLSLAGGRSKDQGLKEEDITEQSRQTSEISRAIKFVVTLLHAGRHQQGSGAEAIL